MCYVAVNVAFHAVGCYHGEVQSLAGFGALLECADFMAQVLLVVTVDFVFVAGKLHLAKVDDIVAAVDDEVNLCAAFPVFRFLKP